MDRCGLQGSSNKYVTFLQINVFSLSKKACMHDQKNSLPFLYEMAFKEQIIISTG